MKKLLKILAIQAGLLNAYAMTLSRKAKFPLSILFFLLLIGHETRAQQGGYALKFDGTNDYVAFPAGIASGLTNFTFEAWVYWNGAQTSYWQRIFDFGNSSTAGYMFLSAAGDLAASNGKPRFGITTSDNTHEQQITAANILSLNQWHHVAVTIDNGTSTGKLYIDGLLEGTNTGMTLNPSDIGSTPNNWLGKSQFSDPYFNGILDEIRIWNVARTEAEIKAKMYKELLGNESGLVAYYKMSNGSGSTLSDNKTGGTNNATISDALWKASGCFAGPRNALDFDGIDDYICSQNTLTGPTTFTLEAWFKTSSLSGGGIVGFNEQTCNTATCGGYDRIIWMTDDGRVNFYFWNSGAVILTSTLAYNDEKYHHVAGTCTSNSNGEIKLYVDGMLVASSSSINYSSSTQYLKIGGMRTWTDDDGDYFLGTIDEVRLWNTARTEVEIRENMMHTLVGNEGGLVAYYRMDYGDGTTLYDNTNAYNGTLTNMEPATDWVASSAFNTWTGGESTAWETAANWSRNAVPVSTDNASIPTNNSGSYPSITTSAIACNNLSIGSGTTLDINFSGTHTIYGSVFVIGTSNIKSGNLLNVTGSFYMLPFSTLNIKPGGYLTIGGKLEADYGTFTVESGAASQGSLIVGGSFSGSVNVQRYITMWSDASHGWHFLSSPVASQAISAFHTAGSGNDFYKWNEPTNEWINRTATGGGLNSSFETNFWVGTGYLIANSSTSTKTFSGTLNLSNVAVSGLTYTASSDYKGWHLLGNPFSSALEWNKTGNSWSLSGTVSASCQVFNEADASYTVIGANGIIPAMNGFMVYTSAAGGSLTIPTAARVHSSTNWYKSASASGNRMVLKAIDPQGQTAQESIIRFDAAATDGFDLEFDSYFMAGYAPMFYSTCENEMYALNTQPRLSEELQIPMGFVKNGSSDFTIVLQENIPGTEVYLSDLKTGINHKLNDGAYSFAAEIGDDPDRFLLRFGAVGTDDPKISAEQPKVWQVNGRLYVESKDMIKMLEIFDLQGRRVFSNSPDASSLSVQLHLTAGVYLVRITTSRQTMTTRLFIQ